MINKLKSRLEDAGPFVEPLEGVAFEYGFNTNRLQEILNYWKNSYIPKWTERQEFLNQFSHFKTQIQGLNIHFIHVKPKVKEGTKVFPLLVRIKTVFFFYIDFAILISVLAFTWLARIHQRILRDYPPLDNAV